MLRVRDVTRVFPADSAPVHALRGVDLDVPAGSFTAILGESGCGKTTLLRILAGFDRPDGGRVEIDGSLVAGDGRFVRPERRRVGIVAQEGALFPHLTVAANIAYGLPGGLRSRFGPAQRENRARRVTEMLRLVGMAGYGDRRPDELSGGQQQRVALARALAPAPAVLLLDEPFSALDASLRVELREEVRDLLRRIDATAVLVTHDQSEALSLADQVAMMRDGRVIQAAAPADLYACPVDPPAAAFLGESVEIPCTATADGEGTVTVDSVLGRLRVARSTVFDDRLILRPEHLELGDHGAEAIVTSVSFFGHDGLARLALPDGTPLLVRTAGSALPAPGSTVHVHVTDALTVKAPTPV
ncbi:MAG: ABC transporter ATP-binding protein [Gordonia sp. (in: high G+C Gram-positive bacteria)]|uniref:ABC transporter ATP-binding protein n=1 Tax=Gordonia sp. (in: high G+C Gram-positive bacteria) TaxID=84139 RepID=UPI003C7073FC